MNKFLLHIKKILAEHYRKAGKKAVKKKNFERSERFFRKAQKIADDQPIYPMLFALYQENGDAENAGKAVKKYVWTTDYFKTIKGFDEDRSMPTALDDISYLFKGEYMEIYALMMRGEFDRMYEECTAALKKAPENGDLYVIRAYAFNRKKTAVSKVMQLNKDLTEALKYRPDDIMVLRARCCLSATKRCCREQNIGDVTKLLELDPKYREKYLLSRAYYYRFAQWDEQAVPDLEEVIGMNGPMKEEAERLLNNINAGTVKSGSSQQMSAKRIRG